MRKMRVTREFLEETDFNEEVCYKTLLIDTISSSSIKDLSRFFEFIKIDPEDGYCQKLLLEGRANPSVRDHILSLKSTGTVEFSVRIK